MRRAARVDANHKDVVEAFRKLGCSVLSLAAIGKGAPDLAVGWAGLTCMVEVKAGPKKGLTPDQVEFWNTWKGGVRLVRDMAGVEETVRTLQAWHRKLQVI